MDIAFLTVVVIISTVLLLAIAMPERLLPNAPSKKKKTVGSSHWGCYEEADPTKIVGEIEVKPLASTLRTCYGANSYAKGKGVSRRGA
ncbi:MAG: hypothetical protein SGJ27_03220 [Candidatus Melainabacteria bacterium]|nr:hypothetical protein [Candidatus Melainabacteria bacterium]